METETSHYHTAGNSLSLINNSSSSMTLQLDDNDGGSPNTILTLRIIMHGKVILYKNNNR